MASATSGVTASVVYTGKTGPGNTVTSITYTNLKQVNFDVYEQTVTLIDFQGKVIVLDYNPLGTFTATIASGLLTITLS